MTGRITIGLTGQALIHRGLAPAGADVVAGFLRGADLVVANLETVLATPGAWATKTKTVHACEESVFPSLAGLGIGILAHANNHAFDLGPPGLAATRAAAERTGLTLTGSGPDLEAALAPAVVRTADGSVAVLAADCGPQADIVYAGADRAGIAPLRLRRRVTLPPAELRMLTELVEALGDARKERQRAAVGYRSSAVQRPELFGVELEAGDAIRDGYLPDPADLARFLEALAAARAAHDLVIVALHSHHWGADWTRTPAWATALATRLLDAGADLVVGTGVPLLQPLAFHGAKPWFPCLGNLVFHTRRAETYAREGMAVFESVVCTVELAMPSRELVAIRVLPIAVGRPAERGPPPPPSPLAREDAERVLAAFCSSLTPDQRALVCLAG